MSMQGLKWIHVSKRGYRSYTAIMEWKALAKKGSKWYKMLQTLQAQTDSSTLIMIFKHPMHVLTCHDRSNDNPVYFQ